MTDFHRIATAAAFVGLFTLAGCTADDPATGPKIGMAAAARSALVGAPALVEQARNGALGRGEQDVLVALEAQLPGFGGLYIANGEVRVYIKTATTPPATIRNVLAERYARHDNPLVRNGLANVGRATVLPARYSLSELIAIERRVAASALSWTAVGTNIMRNRVVVGFADNSTLERGLSRLASIGVPVDAILPMIMPLPTVTATWEDKTRPTRGGIGINVGNETRVPGFWGTDPKFGNPQYKYWSFNCSLGYNVRTTAGVDYFMTASHCANLFSGTNGVTGDTLFQVIRDPTYGGPIGTFVINPPWNEGAACPINAATNLHYDFCTTADVALGQYFPGVGYERKIGASSTGGINGNKGSQSIAGWYSITGVYSPEYVDSVGNHANKSGRTTGTTSGDWIFTMGNQKVSVCWNRVSAMCNPRTVLWQNVAAARGVADLGDSGGPVFAAAGTSGSPYAALGIQSSGIRPTSYPCTTCAFVFSRWDMIQARMGLGPLRPMTVIP